MQDMGAAGIICSTAEMSAKGEVGMHIDLDKVPTRQKNMKAWELLLSESQERMLLVAHKGREKEVIDVFEKWDLSCNEIGHVTDDGLLQFYMHGNLEASIPAHELVLGGGAPQYKREYKAPAYLDNVNSFLQEEIADVTDLAATAHALNKLPNIASKRWIYTQYDSMVGAANASTNAPSDASIVLAKGTGKALAITVDCNSRYVHANPYTGAMIAVAEAARNIVCSGGEPIGVTNCLNFGNPYDPEVYYQFVEAIRGMGDACRAFETPVTGGNVSFYNQKPDGPVFPTPTIGMVGVLDDFATRLSLGFKQAGDLIYLVGKVVDDIACSEYLYQLKGVKYSPAPYFNLEEELAVQQFIASANLKKLLASAHDISEGGVIISLLESAYPSLLGFTVTAQEASTRNDAFWMGEAQGRVIVSVKSEWQDSFLQLAKEAAIPVMALGTVAEKNVQVNGENWGNIETFRNEYDTAIESFMNAPTL
jgi:phosphoribosylformylglycinamidine synthase